MKKLSKNIVVSALTGTLLLSTMGMTGQAVDNSTGTNQPTVLSNSSVSNVIDFKQVVDVPIKKGDVLEYKLKLDNVMAVDSIGVVKDSYNTSSLNITDAIKVDYYNSRGALVSTSVERTYLGVLMTNNSMVLDEGEYTVKVTVLKDLVSGARLNFTVDGNKEPVIVEPYEDKITDLKLSRKGVIPVGVYTTIRPLVKDSDMTYLVEVKTPNGEYKEVAKYNSAKGYKFTGKEVGTNYVKFTATDKEGNTHTRIQPVEVVKAVKTKIKSIKPTAKVVKSGKKVKLKVSATGGKNLKYKYVYWKKGKSPKVVAKDYVPYKEYSYSLPKTKGVYYLEVYVKQENGKISTKKSTTVTVK